MVLEPSSSGIAVSVPKSRSIFARPHQLKHAPARARRVSVLSLELKKC